MNGQSGNSSARIDGKTSRSICDAVGQRLQQSLQPDFSQLPDHLRDLMDALRRQDREMRSR
ncbi:hypothetical protein [Bradyrhizobium sp. STM 3562]|uniref:hypothetical protein n=1 Tax=Bradyrhizobium sp. STM 3562 TaxID=578924 RepID=UPI00388F2DF9